MFATPLGLLALAALPAVAWLHLYRRRSRPRVVSALFLWPVDPSLAQAGRRREKLYQDVSFWCELAAALCLALALAGPRGCARDGQHLVAVIDSSASMAAIDPKSGASAMDRARQALEPRIEALPTGSRVTLIASGRPPRVVAGPAALPAEARASLRGEVPSLRAHDLEPAVELALELAAEGEVLLLSDRLDKERWPPSVSILATGVAAPNVALASARRFRSETDETGDSSDRIELSVQSFDGADRSLALVLRDMERTELERFPLELAAGERQSFGLDWNGEQPVEVELLIDDALALDNRAYLPPPPQRTVHLFSTLDPGTGRALGIAEGDGLGQEAAAGWASLANDARAVNDATQAHLVLTNKESGNTVGESRPWRLVLAASGGEPRAWIGPFLIDKSAAALVGLSLDGVVWTSGSGSDGLGSSGVPLIAVGNEALLTESVANDGVRTWRADIELERSSLHHSPDWPILLHNVVEARRADLPGPQATQLVVGDNLIVRAQAPATYRLEAAGEEETFSAQSDVARTDLDTPGWLQLEREGANPKRWTFGVSFVDGRESDLRNLVSGEHVGQGERARIEANVDTWQLLALVLALACLSLDWRWLDRRTPRETRKAA